MKPLSFPLILALVALGCLALEAQTAADAVVTNQTAPVVEATLTNAPPAITNAAVDTPAVSPPTNAPAPARPVASTETSPPAKPSAASDDRLRLNFRGVPIDMVLNYLSEAAGFVIVLETEVKGKVDVWSQQPVTKDEAVALLNTILNKNGYAAIRNGRTLTIVSRDEAKKRDLPVRKGSDPEGIPKNDEMVTQILPVRYANAVQMTKDLLPLLPTYASMTANESGNALVITDTQSDIRRMAEIVKALDTSISGIATIRVIPLRYADAKELATELKELFPPPTAGNTGGQRQGFGRFGGGGPPGMPGMPGGAQSDGSQSEAKRAASSVTAVADERTNSLIVSAPDELMETIEKLVAEIDTNAENITEVRVFRLMYSDPVEMADLLSQLFPDSTQTDNNRSAVQFGRGGPGGRFGMGNAQTTPSNRTKQKGRVVAVPDQRTSSVVVSAASELMPQIDMMITQLDANPAKKQKVFVYSLENADVDNVQQVLQDMFQSQNSSRATSTRSTTSNPLTTRQRNQSYGTTSGSGSGSSFGSSSGGTGTRRTGQ